MAYDAADLEVVYFGGCGVHVCPNNETWTYAGGRWSNVTNYALAPSARSSAAMDYNGATGHVLLYGGCGVRICPLGDTWTFHAGTWTNVTSLAGTPGAAYAAGMVSFRTSATIMFGGCTVANCSATGSTTWEYFLYPFCASSASPCWVSLKTTVAPASRAGQAMAYDSADGYVLLFGGFTLCGFMVFCDLNDTWKFDGTKWTDITYSGSSSVGGYPNEGRSFAMMTSDGLAGYVLMFGGANGTTGIYPGGISLSQNWEFFRGLWSPVLPSSSPPPRARASAMENSSVGPAILFGGADGSRAFGDTWVYEPAVLASGLVSPSTPETNQTVFLNATSSGGSGRYGYLWSFGDGASSTNPQSTHTYRSTGLFLATLTVTDSEGAQNVATYALQVTSPSVTASATPSATDVGFNVTLTALVLTGVPPFSYNWSLGDGSHSLGSTVLHRYAAAGTVQATVVVTDEHRSTNRSSVSVTVNSPLAILASSVPAAPLVGQAVNFSTTTVGGTTPLTFSWKFGDGTSSVSANPVHHYAFAGTFSVTLSVNDSVGASVRKTLSVAVHSAENPQGAGVPWFTVGILVAVLAGIALALWLLFFRRRGPTAEIPPPPPVASTTAIASPPPPPAPPAPWEEGPPDSP